MSTTGSSPALPVSPAPGVDLRTGGPDPTVPVGRLEELARRPGRSVAVLIADIDELGVIRRTHGQSGCDRLMKAVAGRLSRLLRSGDRLARLDGNRFVVLVDNDDEPGPIEALTAGIDAASNGSFGIAGLRFEVASTVGVAFAGRGEDVPAELLRGADAVNAGTRTEPATIDLRDTTPPGRPELRTVLDPTGFDRTV